MRNDEDTGVNQNLSSITLGQIDIFLTVVELESFTKTALKLHMTQSAVSKTIAKLERQMGVILFQRRYRELVVTDVARELYAQWKPRLEQMTGIYEEIFGRFDRENDLLRIGVTNTTDLKLYFWDIVNEFQARCGDVNLEFSSDAMESLVRRLAGGQLDVVFLPDFMKYRLEDNGFLWVWAAKDQVQIILPEDHPLATSKTQICLADIKDMTFLTLTDSEYPENARYFKELFADAGYELKTQGRTYKTPESILDFYRKEDGIMLTDNFFKYNEETEQLVRIPLSGYENGIICGWNPDKEHRGRKLFVEMLNNMEL